MSEKVYDITIIGGGPVGLFTAFYGGMRQASVKIIESLPQLGGQLSALYPEKYIYDVAGFPKVRAQELVDNLIEQANQFDPSIALNEAVQEVEKLEDETFKLTTNKGVHYTKTIIITAGNGAFSPRRLKIDNCEQFEESNLFYHVDNMERFAGQNVMVCGGGDSAVDWALMLEPIAKQVTLVHRRDKFRAHEHTVEQLHNSSVNIMTPYNPEELVGSGGSIDQVVLKESKGEGTETLDIDSLIVNYGFISSLGPIKDWSLDIEKNNIVVNSRMETNIKGIYAAGDICTYPGKVKLIASGFGEGPTAVNNAKAYMDPKAKVQPMHSTSLFGS
ncbi:MULTISPECIES: NAD(P)/FAD-dependent oxidoreductase [Pontibacillus]|uniref:Ferredoxin--NADP reductase n=1 Tax=Pontibacillus chungwhensis TaxID=265426 RepID=A0ABY8UXD0_9BACI|nr:NAD(P)/FAD-dependent oxidoreductase [Pontibacillus chungwhensis]MCD5325147.1 NAD(P)/FAD-dependent oxidoreductase [Pontibacillus sp. HN14]WIF97396.1 NAD(P)/FAD-dependent oxidoreductase [Pontibacillus chungwhensis]